MPQFKRVDDRWRHLRKDLYGNVEPEVKLEAVTMPVKYPAKHVVGNRVDYLTDRLQVNLSRPDLAGPACIDARDIEMLPAISAGVSYGVKEKLENDSERAIKLNKELISKGHHTPLEAIQLNFHISGISKACGAQISRHRVGQGHVSGSRRFKSAEPRFVYPVLDYVENQADVVNILKAIESLNECSFYGYDDLKHGFRSSRKFYLGPRAVDPNYTPVPKLHKEDARMVLPVSYATERSWWINVRALRDFFRLRLAADAEWEIRRLAWMMLDLVCPLLPSLFEDIKEVE